RNSVAKINLTTQRDIRLWVLDQLLTRDEDFRKAFKIVHKTQYTTKIDLIKFDVPIDLVAV
ncbi:hypothetical protein LCGC14_2150220, partial [marine sediment metagenome]